MVQQVTKQPATTGVSVQFQSEQIIYNATGRRWDPGTDNTNCIQFLTADDIDGLADGDQVATWPKRVGQDFTQGTAGNRPLYRATAWDTTPALETVDFVSADQVQTSSLSSASGDWTFYFVFNPDTTTGNQSLFGTTTGAMRIYHCYGSGTGNIYIMDDSFRDTGVAPTTGKQLLTLNMTAGGTTTVRRNGTQLASGSFYMTARAIGGVTRLGSTEGGGHTYDGDVSVMVISDGADSSTVRDKTEGYLAWYWGLQESLPFSHAYRHYMPTI